MILFETIFSRLHVFCYIFIYLFYYFSIKPWNGGIVIEEFFLIYKDYACTKGSGDLPDFLIIFFYEIEEFMHVF